MPRLRRLSSGEVIAILRQFGFEFYSQRGSHIKIVRTETDGSESPIIVPRRRQIPIGTLHNIHRKACQYIPEDQVHPYFYTD